MIWGYIFIGLIGAATLYVLLVGNWETRLAILTLVCGSALSVLAVYLSGQYYESANLMVASVDLVVLAVFFAHALVSRRYWVLCLPALQLITCTTHLAKLLAPDIVPRVYSAAQGHWAYYQIVLILAAAHMDRLRREILRQWERRHAVAVGAGDV